MSFGSSVGDIIKIGELAYKLWRACSNASPEFKELRRELGSIEITLRSLGDDASNPSSLVCRRGETKRNDVMHILGNLKLALLEVESLVTKYQSLGLLKKRTFDRVKFASHDLADLRQKLSVHLQALNTFYTSLSTGSLARIESLLEDIYKDVRNGDREPTIISMCDSPGDEDSWTLLKQELEAEDVAVSDVEKYRAEIVSFLKELTLSDSGDVEPYESCSNDPTVQQLALGDLLISEKLRQNDFNLDDDNLREAESVSALLWAAEMGDVDLVHFLIRHETDVNGTDCNGTTALHNAVRAGHLEVVKELISAGADIEAYRQDFRPHRGLFTGGRSWNAYTVLMDAAEKGRLAIIRLLLQSGATVNTSKYNLLGYSPLHVAIASEHHAAVCALLDAGAAIDQESPMYKSCSPLYLATEIGSLPMVRYLIERGAKPDKICGPVGLVLSHAAVADVLPVSRLKICRLLLDHGAAAKVPRSSFQGIAPLHAAIRVGDSQLLKLFLERGADPNYVDESESSPLCEAIASKSLSPEIRRFFVKCLIDEGASVLECKSSGKNVNPVNLAIKHTDTELLQSLLMEGSSPEAYKDEIDSPVSLAIRGGVDNASRMLILQSLAKAGAQFERCLYNGNPSPAIHIAISYGRLSLIQYLFSLGVSLDVVDMNGTTPLCRASMLQNNDTKSSNSWWYDRKILIPYERQCAIVKCLIVDGGANASQGRHKDVLVNPLNVAIDNKNIPVMRTLLECGCDISSANFRGKSPLMRIMELDVDEEVQMPMMEELLKVKCDVNYQTPQALMTVLHKAAAVGKAQVLGLLLGHGANVNIADYWNSNALHLAVEARSEECVVRLLRAGANPRQESCFGDYSFTPLDIAVINEDTKLIKLLEPVSHRTFHKGPAGTNDVTYGHERLWRMMLLSRKS